jgi:hypothetical protein
MHHAELPQEVRSTPTGIDVTSQTDDPRPILEVQPDPINFCILQDVVVGNHIPGFF